MGYVAKEKTRPTILLAIWLLLICAGLGAVTKYRFSPTESGIALETWPLQSDYTFPNMHTIVVSLHPECSCSGAVLGELRRIKQTAKLPLHIYAFLVVPEFSMLAAEDSPIWDDLASLTQDRHIDWDGRESQLFGARSSGDVSVFSPEGRLLFKGGVTMGRGHAGPNVFSESVISLLDSRVPRYIQAPSFGCHLPIGNGRGI